MKLPKAGRRTPPCVYCRFRGGVEVFGRLGCVRPRYTVLTEPFPALGSFRLWALFFYKSFGSIEKALGSGVAASAT